MGPDSPPGKSSKASGIDSDRMNIAPMAAKRTTRTLPSSARSTLNSQAYPTQLHHSRAIMRTARMTPRQLSSSANAAVTWVSAKTNTRSKKSSMEVTLAFSRFVSRWRRSRAEVIREIVRTNVAADNAKGLR